jgi:hypothetical protein
MTIDYSIPGKVQIKMFDYIKAMLEELPEDMGNGIAATPASNHLFEVNSDGIRLDATNAELFHHVTAKSLFLCKRARPELQTAVAFLTTRVAAPDEDDMKKLTRMMDYIRGSQELVLTLEADDLSIIKWWVDGSFGVHPDMRSHTGAVMSLGGGAAYGKSTIQRLNTRSSTEAELVAVDDTMSQILWTRYFLRAQGYDVQDNIVYQDNRSAMLLENNGRASSSKRTRHINVRYFFVTDRIKTGELRVEYCPTQDMKADYFTKPLQGQQFRKFRTFILNLPATIAEENYALGSSPIEAQVHRSVLENKDKVPTGTEDNEWQVVTRRKSRVNSRRSLKRKHAYPRHKAALSRSK